MSDPPASSRVADGLDGVIVAETTIGEVRGREGFYHYRRYSAIELARSCSLEEVWHLLSEGELPTASQLEGLTTRLAPLRSLPNEIRPVLEVMAAERVRPIDALRTAVSATAALWGLRPSLDLDPDQRRADGLRLCAVMPTLVAALHRLGRGLDPVAPNDDLGHAANTLFMLTGEVPDPVLARALEQYLITTVDHGLNASTFTGRVIISTGADLGSALVGAIGALSGPLHGGAPARVLDMLDQLADLEVREGPMEPGGSTGPEDVARGVPADVATWVRSSVRDGRRIMGFGHRLYQGDDPRAVFMREVAQRLGGSRIDHAVEVERQVLNTLGQLKPGHRLGTNVEFYAGVVMERCGLERDLFTSMFACARAIGWSAHVVEQAAKGRPIRPSAVYVGGETPQPIPRSR
ncbi:MAG: citrate synthase/methylcitrate synthase [Actinobacteria bacterium]|nr:citrate synthase/methylcitrate synthase [Actinomycetota bacterium]